MPFQEFTHKDVNGSYFDDADKIYLDDQHQKEILKEVKQRDRKERKIRLLIKIIAFTETALFAFIIGAFIFILWFVFG